MNLSIEQKRWLIERFPQVCGESSGGFLFWSKQGHIVRQTEQLELIRRCVLTLTKEQQGMFNYLLVTHDPDDGRILAFVANKDASDWCKSLQETLK